MSESFPSEESIKVMMEKLVRQVDLKTVTTKQFIATLQKEMGGIDLSSKKQYIKYTLTEILDAMDHDEDTEVEDETDQLDRTNVRKRRSGLTMAKQISPELAAFLGTDSTTMARTDVVRLIWEYIKVNQLQNPEDKREILLDHKMKALFHCDKVTIFSINKYVSSHMDPFPKVNLNELSENSKKKKAGKAERRAQQASKKRKRNGEPKPKRVVRHPPFRLSPSLSCILGKDILPRPQVTRLLWVYIKEHNLQNPEDKREIICDEHLRKIMGGNEKVTIFSMNKHITPHLLEQVDKSSYDYGEAGNGEEDATGEGNLKRDETLENSTDDEDHVGEYDDDDDTVEEDE